ncbi:MAG TPA: hypothetical protein VM939_14825 [Gemmatimonadaceae bacterium]|nr:hypothetical protein [Gemmatimonadaceae bacterium]
MVTDMHATTNPSIVTRFLALRPGMACTEVRRLESERILRTQPYLADAKVTAHPDSAGGVYISVVTVDETSLLIGGGASGNTPFVRSFRLGEANFMGEAMSVVGNWRYSEDFRDNYSARIIDYQFLGRPYQLMLEGSRRELGGDWGFELSHPFLSDLQRYSWRTTAGSGDSYMYFRRPNAERLAIRLKRSYSDAGGVVRIGRVGRLVLLGASMSYERELPDPFATSVGFGTTERDTNAVLNKRYTRMGTTRINALAGFRDVSYLRVSGFEALDGLQDVRKGFELATLVGRGVDAIGGREHDLFMSANLYSGVGSPTSFGAIEVLAEGRRDGDNNRWDGILASGRVAAYIKPKPRHTITTSLEYSGGWRQRIPFQLSFAEKDGGPRGYADSWLAGGRRLVVRLEDRIFLTGIQQFASIGVAPFIDAGKLWAGDAPFGVNSKVSASVGIGLLGALPPRSQKLWRVDLSVPINPEAGAKWGVKVSSRNFTRMFWKEPGDVHRNRERALPTSVFNWP